MFKNDFIFIPVVVVVDSIVGVDWTNNQIVLKWIGIHVLISTYVNGEWYRNPFTASPCVPGQTVRRTIALYCIVG